MQIIYTIDKKDYEPNAEAFYRPSAKAIIRKDDKIVLLYSRALDFYEFPGGGIEAGETKKQALIREVSEETGLSILTESIRPFGCIRRKQKGKFEPLFIQDNFFYFCDTAGTIEKPRFTPGELQADFILKYITVAEAIEHMHKKTLESPFDSFFQITLYVLNSITPK